jgi:hypothetical protein
MNNTERLKMSISDKILEVVYLVEGGATRSDVEGVAMATAAVIITEVQIAELKGWLK